MFSFLRFVLKKAFTPFTIMIIPHNSGKSRRIQIPSIGIIFVIGLFLLSCSLSASYVLQFTSPALSTNIVATAVPLPSPVKPVVPKQPIVQQKTPQDIRKEVLAEIAETKLEEIQCTLESLKKRDEELKKLLCYDSKEELFSNVEFSDPLTLDLEEVQEEARRFAEGLKSIKEYIQKERDDYFAIPRGWPVKGKITERFGRRKNPVTKRWHFHAAVDIGGRKRGAPIEATADGIVSYSGWKKYAGRVVIIEHGNGYQTLYAHNHVNLVKVGQVVNRGDVIAHLGSTGRSTGPHVHYSIKKNGKPINPLRYIKLRHYKQKNL